MCICYRFNLHEAMQMILEDDEVLRADVYIGPPNNGTGSDDDFGDENDGLTGN